MTARQCLDCTFWESRKKTPTVDDDGECRRHAPSPAPEAAWLSAWKTYQADDDVKEWNGKVDISPWDAPTMLGAYWPSTQATEWCGEFAREPATSTTS